MENLTHISPEEMLKKVRASCPSCGFDQNYELPATLNEEDFKKAVREVHGKLSGEECSLEPIFEQE